MQLHFSLKVREEEAEELEELAATSCPLRLKKGALATVPGKINCLIQVSYFTLVSLIGWLFWKGHPWISWILVKNFYVFWIEHGHKLQFSAFRDLCEELGHNS